MKKKRAFVPWRQSTLIHQSAMALTLKVLGASEELNSTPSATRGDGYLSPRFSLPDTGSFPTSAGRGTYAKNTV